MGIPIVEIRWSYDRLVSSCVTCHQCSLTFLFPVVLYAISAAYFAGVMVRLMLTLTPVVCILAAIAFSKTFDIYLKDDTVRQKSQEEDKEKNDKYYDKVIGPHSGNPCQDELSLWNSICRQTSL